MSEARSIDHPIFGVMPFEADFGWYQGKMPWQGRIVEVSLAVEEGDPAPVAALAHAFWLQQDAWAERIRAALLAEMLPLKNEIWLEDAEAPVSETEFLSRILPQGLTFYPSGGFEFFFADGDLFFGHTIIAAYFAEDEEFEVKLGG